MIVLVRNGYDVHIKKENGTLEKLHINMQSSKNDGLGLPVVNIEKYSLGRKWITLSKLKEGENIIEDADLYSKSQGPIGSKSKVEYDKALSKEEFDEYQEIKKRLEELEQIAQNKWKEIAEKVKKETKEKKVRMNKVINGKIKIDEMTDEERQEIIEELKAKLGL